jgi:hypothetical protein
VRPIIKYQRTFKNKRDSNTLKTNIYKKARFVRIKTPVTGLKTLKGALGAVKTQDTKATPKKAKTYTSIPEYQKLTCLLLTK